MSSSSSGDAHQTQPARSDFDPTGRLAALGLTLPTVVAPVASYLPATRDGDLVWTSGQLPMVGGTLAATGAVGEGAISVEQATALAQQCALNALAAVVSVTPGGLAAVQRIIKVVGYVASRPDFNEQPQVVNGASDLLTAIFGDGGRHARSAVGVAALPLGAPVELELIVRVS
ncbi:MAG: RidA family protein [Actinomycetota bacterium]